MTDSHFNENGNLAVNQEWEVLLPTNWDGSLIVGDGSGVVEYNKPKSKLEISDGLAVYFDHVRPNAWWRFWQFVLLGWRWKEVKE